MSIARRESSASGGAGARRTPAPAVPTVAGRRSGLSGCSRTFQRSGFPDNVRANVDCGYRFQSEEWVAVNPTDPKNIVASQSLRHPLRLFLPQPTTAFDVGEQERDDSRGCFHDPILRARDSCNRTLPPRPR